MRFDFMSSSSIRSLCQIALFAAIIAVCSQIQIPLTVPFTMQTFAVFSALAILGGKNGTISILIYIALGAIGVPVFAGFSGGIGVLFGTTGGYILGFLFSGLLYWLITHFLGTKLPVMIAAMALGLIVCYTFGTVWFIQVYTSKVESIGLMAALGWCVFPFILPDCVKIALAILIAKRLPKRFVYQSVATKKDAGYMENLILSCHDCNHNKNSFWIEKEEMDTLNPDGEKIKNVFIRDDKYYIRINDEFKENTTIEGFYNKLCLGSELHRLDYLIMNIIGLQRSCEDNSDLYVGLGKILDTIREKRNIM